MQKNLTIFISMSCREEWQIWSALRSGLPEQALRALGAADGRKNPASVTGNGGKCVKSFPPGLDKTRKHPYNVAYKQETGDEEKK